jgi:hypothetical protein
MTIVVAVCAFVAGLTGSWSPCGFSMVETLAPRGYAGRMRVTLAACATFAAGALAGGVATFGALALLGHALGAGGSVAAAVAGAIALAAAAGEARGARIVPQVRRQVPEPWRRLLALPLAAGLYGVLLGLGFTTFILTFAVWALAGVSVALGDPSLGLATGLAFGLGRLLPVVVLAPAAVTRWGIDAHAAMAERPAILRGMRAADAVALAACAAVIVAAPAHAATARVVAGDATDPSVAGRTLAWHDHTGAGVLDRRGQRSAAPGRRPAVGGGRIAWIADGTVVVGGGADMPAGLRIPDPAASSVAVSHDWLAWRSGETIRTIALPSGAPGRGAVAPTGRSIGRPALDGATLLYHRTTRTGAIIRLLDLASGRSVTLRREARALLLNPSARGGRLLYVRSTYKRQQLRLGPLRARAPRHDRILWSTVPTGRRDAEHEPGYVKNEDTPGGLYPRPPAGRSDTLWTTALGSRSAYVTRLRQDTGKPVRAALLRVPLP